jgi:predicted exporter
MLGLLAAMVIAAVLRPGPLWETDLANLGAVSPQVRERDRLLRADLNAPDVRYLLVVRGDDAEMVLQRQEDLQPALEAAVTAGLVKRYEMAANLLPSARLQHERQVLLPERTVLTQSLRAAVQNLPIKASALTAFVDDVVAQRTRQPVVVGDLPPGPLRWRVEPLLRHERGGVSGLVFLQGPVDAAAMANLAAAAGDGVHFLDMRRQASRLVVGYRDAVLVWLAIGAVAGLGVLLLGMRSPRQALRVATPAAIAVVATIAILVLSGVPLTLFHLLALLLVAGVGVDYALFFVGYSRDTRDGERNLRSVMLCNASTVVVFATLAFSSMPVLNGIGLTVALGVVTALLMTLVFLDPNGAARE